MSRLLAAIRRELKAHRGSWHTYNLPHVMARGTSVRSGGARRAGLSAYGLYHSIYGADYAAQIANHLSAVTDGTSPNVAASPLTGWGMDTDYLDDHINAGYGFKATIRAGDQNPQGEFDITIAGTSLGGEAISNKVSFSGIKRGGVCEIFMLPVTVSHGGAWLYAPYRIIDTATTDTSLAVTYTGLTSSANVTVTSELLTRGHYDLDNFLRGIDRRNRMYDIRTAAAFKAFQALRAAKGSSVMPSLDEVRSWVVDDPTFFDDMFDDGFDDNEPTIDDDGFED